MESITPPGEIIGRYLSQKGSAHIRVLARIGNTTEDIAESIVRDFVYEGRARYLHDEQEGGLRVAIWTGGF